MKCRHNKTEIHKHHRRNYPFGKKSKPRFYGIKYCTMHCLKCKKVLYRRNI